MYAYLHEHEPVPNAPQDGTGAAAAAASGGGGRETVQTVWNGVVLLLLWGWLGSGWLYSIRLMKLLVCNSGAPMMGSKSPT